MKKRYLSCLSILLALVLPIQTILASSPVPWLVPPSSLSGYNDTTKKGMAYDPLEDYFYIEKPIKSGYINRKGDFFACTFKGLSEGLIPALKEDKFGYIDLLGKVIIPYQFDEALPFSEGLAAVKKDGNFGYIDRSGAEVIPCQFDEAQLFSEGLAVVEKNDEVYFIDTSGTKQEWDFQFTYRSPYYRSIAFSNGYCVVNIISYENDGSGTLGEAIIDKEGLIVLVPLELFDKYDVSSGPYIREISEGVVSFDYQPGGMNSTRSGMVNIATKEFLVDFAYGIRPFSEGFAAWHGLDEFEEDGVVGYEEGNFIFGSEYGMNCRGKIFTFAGEFHEEIAYAMAKGEDQFGFINKNGEWVLSPAFDRVGSFYEGLCPVQKEDRWGYINHNGELVLDYQFDSAGDFYHGVAEVKIDEDLGYIRNPLLNETRTIQITLDGKELPLQQKPKVFNNRIVVPLTETCAFLGIDVAKQEDVFGFILEKDGVIVKHTAGRLLFEKNGTPSYSDTPSIPLNNALFIPVKELESFGYRIHWNAVENTIVIVSTTKHTKS